MDLKQQLMAQAFKLMQDPRVAKALQNPKLMQGLMGAIQMQAQARQNVESAVKKVAESLGLATESELKELRDMVSRLEQELAQKRP